MKTVSASLWIAVMVDCPHCGTPIDLLNPTDTGGRPLDDEGQILSQACPDGSWREAHEAFTVDNVECSECGKEFVVKELEW